MKPSSQGHHYPSFKFYYSIVGDAAYRTGTHVVNYT